MMGTWARQLLGSAVDNLEQAGALVDMVPGCLGWVLQTCGNLARCSE